jgi:hypothetical protein
VRAALEHRDVLLYTSREFVAGRDRDDSLAIGGHVSAILSAAVQAALAAQAAWVLAKGGITPHDVAQQGLGIRRAEVAGQLFAGDDSSLPPAGGGARGGRHAVRRFLATDASVRLLLAPLPRGG